MRVQEADFATMDGLEAVTLDADRVYQAFSRIVTGYLKVVVIAASADYFFKSLSPQFFDAAPLGLLIPFCMAAASRPIQPMSILTSPVIWTS